MIGSDLCQASNTSPNDDMVEKSYIRQVNHIAKQVKEERTRWNMCVMLLLLLVIAHQPGLASLLSMVGIGINGDVSKDNVSKVVRMGNDHNGSNSKATPSRSRRAKIDDWTIYEHNCKCHIPHDPARCDACMRARMMAKYNTSNPMDGDIKGGDKGYVYSLDYIGPYEPDVDGNIYGLVGVEVAHTNYGIVTLTKDKEAATTLEEFKAHQLKIHKLSKDAKKIVRIHHDKDGSFEREFSAYMLDHEIENTNTGGYNPQGNSRVERRNRSIKQAFKAALLYATGGLPYYNSLWGWGIKFAMNAVNYNDDSTGRNYHERLVGSKYEYDIGGNDLSFGQQVFYYVDNGCKQHDWEANGKEAIWVGRSDEISDGHVIVPIEWDQHAMIYKLHPSKHVTHVRYERVRYPLRMGPVHINDYAKDVDEDVFNKYVEGFFEPWYSAVNPSDLENEQIEGEDPILEVEAIEARRGKGKKAKYLVKWKGHVIKTYEPRDHLLKYGARTMVEEYDLKVKHKKGNAVQHMVYYSSVTNEYYCKDDEREVVSELIKKQGKEGTVNDWIDAYREEYNQVYSKRLVELKEDELTHDIKYKALPMRMILENKRDGRRKGRLVAIGYREPREWDIGSNSSPVADLSSVRMLLYSKGLDTDVVSSVDISVAFLQASPYEESAPKRYVSYKPHKHAKTRYYLLTGCLYGQRSASKSFYNTLATWLEKEGYKKCENEPCMFINSKGFKVLSYVDDLICRGSKEETDLFYRKLHAKFECKDESILSNDNALAFLGFDIKCKEYDVNYNHDNGKYDYNFSTTTDGKVRVVTIDQCEAIQEFLINSQVHPRKLINQPMSNYKELTSDDTLLEGAELNKFQSHVGSCNYFSMTTRYDISYAMSRISSYGPTVGARKALDRVMAYLMATIDFNICGICGVKEDTYIAYSDSDLAGFMPYTTLSQSGGVVLLNNVPLKWRSKKQPKTSISSAQAEVYALSDIIGEAKHIAHKMDDINLNVKWPITIGVDNEQAKKFSNDVTSSTKLKSVFNLKDARIKEMKDDGIVNTIHVDSNDNPADLYTKLHSNSRFKYLLQLVNPVKLIIDTLQDDTDRGTYIAEHGDECMADCMCAMSM